MSLKNTIEQKIATLVNRIGAGSPADDVQTARAVQALASALSEVSGGTANTSAMSLLEKALKLQDNQDD